MPFHVILSYAIDAFIVYGYITLSKTRLHLGKVDEEPEALYSNFAISILSTIAVFDMSYILSYIHTLEIHQ